MEGQKVTEQDIGRRIMDLIVMLLEDQNGEPYEYKEVDAPKDETA